MENVGKKKLDMQKLLAPAALVILYIVFSIFGNNFLTLDTVKNILESSYYIGFMAFGVTFIIITGGIDVGAKSEIYKLMTQLAEEGKSIIMISSDMPELLRLSDRVIVMCEGHVTGELDISEATQETIMTYATKREVG